MKKKIYSMSNELNILQTLYQFTGYNISEGCKALFSFSDKNIEAKR